MPPVIVHLSGDIWAMASLSAPVLEMFDSPSPMRIWSLLSGWNIVLATGSNAGRTAAGARRAPQSSGPKTSDTLTRTPGSREISSTRPAASVEQAA